MLTDLQSLSLFLRLSPTDTFAQVYLAALIPVATQVIVDFCKMPLENAVVTEYRDGLEQQSIALRQCPVRAFPVMGNLTLGSPVVTGIPSTTKLFAGMPVVCLVNHQGIPSGTTIASVDSATQCTLTQAATATLPATSMFCGIAVWLDNRGFYGQGGGNSAGGPFASLTQIFPGFDYALMSDAPDGTSRSGVVRRVGYGSPGSLAGCWGETGWGGNQRGGLTARLYPVWPGGMGNLKFVYAAGWGVGAPAGGSLPVDGTQIPADLVMCCNAIAGWIRAATPAGLPMEPADVVRQISAQLSYAVQGTDPETATVRGVLRRYRSVVV